MARAVSGSVSCTQGRAQASSLLKDRTKQELRSQVMGRGREAGTGKPSGMLHANLPIVLKHVTWWYGMRSLCLWIR